MTPDALRELAAREFRRVFDVGDYCPVDKCVEWPAFLRGVSAGFKIAAYFLNHVPRVPR
jgi:hypothetical protein